jgi:ferredoxin
MEAWILQQDKLLEFVGALTKDHEVIAPVGEGPSGGLSYGKIRAAVDVVHPRDQNRCAEKPAKSLKEFFFPAREVLVEYHLGADRGHPEGLGVVTPSVTEEPRVILNAYPCDVAAFPILDKLFAWDFLDSFYLEARERTVLISLACETPCETCFCSSLGGSPADVEGADILLTPLAGVFHVQVVTERGKALLENYRAFFEASDPAHDLERRLFEERAQSKMVDNVDVTDLHERLDYDDPVWQTIARQCVDCGICTFLCPTCHCFDIQDEGSATRGERVRLWDACMFYNYTKAHAGQPRPQHYRRYRQRIMHKFRYYPENFGRTLCVGCGRCIEHCPASIDLRAVLRRVGASGAAIDGASGGQLADE